VINFIPYLRNKISISLAFSTAIMLLLLTTTSPLLLFDLLQPVQASQPAPTSFRTPTPAIGYDECACGVDGCSGITFDVHGTPSSSNPNVVLITNGTWAVIRYGDVAYSGHIDPSPNVPSTFSNYSGDVKGGYIELNGIIDYATPNCPVGPYTLFEIDTFCSTPNGGGGALNPAIVDTYYSNDWRTQPRPVHIDRATGVVECSSYQGGDTTTQSSSMTAGATTQDRDGDGIPDANDNCPNLPNIRCYKEDTTRIIVHSNR
jgi:Thrombospondin type 3 repeat